MNAGALRIATMTPADLETALDWAAAEGWNPGIGDAAAFHAADPGGFLMGWIEDQPVAAISVVRHSQAFAFLGLYLCRPEWRGRGHGLALWRAGMALAEGRTVGLDGVAAQQENYRRSGFVSAGRTIRFLGAVPPGSTAGLEPCDGPEAGRADREATGVERPAFLAAWLRGTPDRRSLALRRDGRIAAFGTVRRCREGLKVGPLTADTPQDAGRLLQALAGLFPERPIALDLPEANPDARALAEGFGMRPSFETARMYRGPAPAARSERIWGVATLELG